MTERLFVYGTLRRGSRHPLAEQLAAKASYLGEARLNGRLYRITHYPGAVASSQPGEWVLGDVYVLLDPGFLTALDRYEGCAPSDAKPTQYLRQLQSVALSDGTAVEAWTYIYNWPVWKLDRIMSGRFEDA